MAQGGSITSGARATRELMMTGDKAPGVDRSDTGVRGEAIAAGVEYDLVEGELVPRGPGARPWDPTLDMP